MKQRTIIVAIVGIAVASGLVGASAQESVDKVDIVAVTGCVVEKAPDTWMLTTATEPVPSIANGPAANQPHEGPTSGKNQFSLIGVSEFDLPSLKDQTVLVKALLIKATPVSRLNLTSVTKVAPSCTPEEK